MDTEAVTFFNEEREIFGQFQDWLGEIIVANEPVMIAVNEEAGEMNIPENLHRFNLEWSTTGIS